MSDEDSGDKKSKGVDISKLGVEMSDEERKAADKKLRGKFKDLSSGVGRLGAAHKAALGLGASGVFADMARQSEQLRRIVDPVGLRSLTMDIDRASFGVSQSILDSLKVDSPFGRLAADMERQSKMFDGLTLGIDQQLGLIPNILRDFESSYALGVTRALDLQHIGDAFAALDIGRYGRIFDNASALRGLGLGPEFGDRFSILATGLTEQLQALGQIGSIASAAQIGLGLSGSIEEMLARTIAAQEALAEQEQVPVDETTRQRLTRQVHLLASICAILSFFMWVALEIEDRLADDKDAAIRANTETMEQMQVSIGALTSQLQEVTAVQEAATEQDRAADAAIADLLREIADSLADQEEGPEADPTTDKN
jgi:HPt (histidine-containing phosphotransfer) domain-containing protein